MFTTDVRKALYEQRKPFLGRGTCANISKMPYSTPEERFALFVEILRYNDDKKYSPDIKIGESVPNLGKVAKLMAEIGTSAFNESIFFHSLKVLASELAGEFYELSNGKPVLEALPEIAEGNKSLSDFCKVGEVNEFNKVFSIKGKSGFVYTGKGITDLSKLNAEQITDIAQAICDGDDESEGAEILRYAVEHEPEMKKKFKNFRVTLISCIQSWLVPERTSKVVDYVKEALKK